MKLLRRCFVGGAALLSFQWIVPVQGHAADLCPLLLRARDVIIQTPVPQTAAQLASSLGVSLPELVPRLDQLASNDPELEGSALRGVRRFLSPDGTVWFDALKINLEGHRPYDLRFTENGWRDLSPKNAFYYAWALLDILEARLLRDGVPNNHRVTLAVDGRYYPEEIPQSFISAIRARGYEVIQLFSREGDPANFSVISHGVRSVRPVMNLTLTTSHLSAPSDRPLVGIKCAMLTKNGTVELIPSEVVQWELPRKLEQLISDGRLASRKSAQLGGYSKKALFEPHTRMIVAGVLALMGKIPGLTLAQLSKQLKGAADVDQTIDSVLSRAAASETHGADSVFSGLRVLIDGANTSSGPLMLESLKRLGAKADLMNGEVQWVRGPHRADPSVLVNLRPVVDRLIAEEYHFALYPDLDGDRVSVIRNRFDGSVEILSPDRMLGPILQAFNGPGGYSEIPNKTVVRDCLGTEEIVDQAKKIGGIQVRTSDSGVVNMKSAGWAAERAGEFLLAMEEVSGHVWTDFTGAVENPTAFSMFYLAAAVLAHEPGSEMGQGASPSAFHHALSLREIPYQKSPIIYPRFAKQMLQRATAHPLSPQGWQLSERGQIPQNVVLAARHESILELKHLFHQDWSKVTPVGLWEVEGPDAYEQEFDSKIGIFRFLRIRFKLNGVSAGTLVARGSSNEPVASVVWEVKGVEGDRRLSQQELTARYRSLGRVIFEATSGAVYDLSPEAPARNVEVVHSILNEQEALPGPPAP